MFVHYIMLFVDFFSLFTYIFLPLRSEINSNRNNMKKYSFLVCSLALLLASCTGLGTTGTGAQGGLGGILGGVFNSGTMTNVLLDVIGLNKLSANEIVGTWKYVEPGVAFTSENTLQKAGGQVISGTVKEKLLPTYNSLGVSSSNTLFSRSAQYCSDADMSAVVGSPFSMLTAVSMPMAMALASPSNEYLRSFCS